MLTDWYQFGTSCQIASAPQQGKSRLAQHFIREHAMNRVPFGLIDFHGTFYQQVLDYLAYLRPKTPIYLLNPSDPKLINPFNPFSQKTDDITAHVSRLSDSIIHAFGAERPSDLPNYQRVIRPVLAVTGTTGEPLHHAFKLLQLPKKELREWAISVMEDDDLKQEWTELQYLSLLKTAFRDWKYEVLSVKNRLTPFIASTAIKLFTGFPSVIDIDRIWDEGGILLANIAPSKFLSPESAKVFGSLLQSEFLHAARMHMCEERPYFLYLDECQKYLTTDAADLINETPKSGLRCTFIHHHAAEFWDRPHIAESLRMGAQIKIAFGGLPPDRARETADEFFMDELNQRKKKADRAHYVPEYDDELTETVTESDYGFSITTGSRLRPRHQRIVDGQEDYTLEEKRSQLAGRLMSLRRGECFVKLPGREAYLWEVPWVEEVLLNPDTILEYIKATQTQAIPFHDAEQKLKEQERAFFERSRSYVPRGGGKKKPAALHPQG